jgi:hypothetical protein
MSNFDAIKIIFLLDKSSHTAYSNKKEKPMSKRSKKDWVYPESRYRWECGSINFSEWTCEGSQKLTILGVGADGNPVRYQWGAYDGMQNEWVYFTPNRVVPQK